MNGDATWFDGDMTDARLNTFAESRFSPMRFDGEHVISQGDVDLLVRAAGRAPSAGNSQPWAFAIGRRGDAIHARLVRHLARSSGRWAPDASVLLANLSHHLVEGTDLQYSEFAAYDLGQALAHLTFQAHAMGLAVHQFRAFDRDALTAELNVPRHWQVTSMAAVGVPLGGEQEGSGTSRERHGIDAITWARA